MNGKLTIKIGDYSHAEAIKDRLRISDQIELHSATGKQSNEIVLKAWAVSLYNWTIMYEDHPIAIFGVAPQALLGYTGSPWMVGTDEMKLPQAQIFVLRNSKKYINKMLDAFPYLMNFVDVRNTLSIKWLKWCGFNFYDPTPYGYYKHLFHRFDMEKKNV